jgi:hypothetical protein
MLRTLVDNSDTVFALTRGLLPLEEQDLRQWKEPDVAVTYLFLKPGLAIPESRYTDSALPIQMVDLGGWTKFLRVYRTAYLESDGYARGRINLVAASFEHCLDAARRTTQGGGPLPELAPMLPFLDRDTAWRTETTELEGLSWASKEELLAAFNSPEAAVDELTRWACSSGTRIKARARDLLSRYFGVDPSTLPCIPCE